MKMVTPKRWFNMMQLVHIELHHLSDPRAFRAHAGRVVKRENMRIAGKRLADSGEEQPEHGINIRDCADRRTGVSAESFLVDNNRRGQVLDAIGIRLTKPGQPIADECGKRLVKLTLSFGADGVENQGRFARARDAGKDRDFVLRDADIHVSKVILACSFNYDIIDFHSLSTSEFYFLSFWCNEKPAIEDRKKALDLPPLLV